MKGGVAAATKQTHEGSSTSPGVEQKRRSCARAWFALAKHSRSRNATGGGLSHGSRDFWQKLSSVGNSYRRHVHRSVRIWVPMATSGMHALAVKSHSSARPMRVVQKRRTVAGMPNMIAESSCASAA